MTEIKLGSKHDCYDCGTKFYDLGKKKALCPSCGADQQYSDDPDSDPIHQKAAEDDTTKSAKGD